MTSAETVLVNEQSTEEFLSKLAEGPRLAVITLSPQSRAALAAHFQIPLAQALDPPIDLIFFIHILSVPPR